MVNLGWNCDFCGKAMLTISLAGVIYCENCHMSYGEVLCQKFDKMTRNGPLAEDLAKELMKILKNRVQK